MGAARKYALPTSDGLAPEDFVPQNEQQLLWCLKSWRWRIFSGQLYKIMTKADEYNDGQIIPFKPNQAQRDFIENLHYRNVILKARQLGFTTLIAILWLDHALFVANQRVGIIAHNKEDATVIFRDKVRFAYDQLPEVVQQMFPLKTANKSELHFANNSSIRVAVSMRSGTIHRLHISEMGKIAAKFPAKALEIVTGSLPAVPMYGIAVIESTAEGRSGEFFKIATKAEKRSYDPRPLGPKEFRFHFYPWHRMVEYQAPANDNTPLTTADHKYFDEVEATAGVKLTLRQRRWYVAERDNGQSGDAEKMWREYPSTTVECWQKSTEGTYFAPQIVKIRASGRLTQVPFISHVPVHTFWDIGSGDGTAIWLMQYVGGMSRFPLFFEDWAKGYGHYINLLRETGQVFGNHYLPHDATHIRQMKNTIAAPLDMLQELAPDWSFIVVPRTDVKQHAIDLLRGKLGEAMFDAEGCKAGFEHIELYHKKWNQRLGMWAEEPEKQDGHSEAADALMQWAQGFDPATAFIDPHAQIKKVRSRQPSGGMAT